MTKQWTEEDARHWVAMYRDGQTFTNIALRVGRSYGTVRRACLALGLVPRTGVSKALKIPCSVDGCEDIRDSSHGWCHMHTERWRRNGTVELSSRVPVPLDQVLWSQVETTGPNDCWEWRGDRNGSGYGTLGWHRPLAHRAAWMLTFGSIPSGLCVMHHCDNPLCCNPAHLSVGTYSENTQDMVAKGRHNSPACKGITNGQSKLDDERVRTMRGLRADGATYRDLVAMFGVSQSVVGAVVRRESWQHVV